jgi:hypothetical protein
MSDAFIEDFTGKLGGGKTYHAVLRILEAFSKGSHVYTNIVLDGMWCARYCRKRFGRRIVFTQQYHYLDNSKIDQFDKYIAKGNGDVANLVVIDEAHLYFNARDWAKRGRELLEFLTQTRKYDIHIILITQHENNLDKQFNRMVQFVWRFKDLKKYRIFGIQYPFDHIVRVCTDGTDARTVLSRKIHSKDLLVFNCYESKAKLKEARVKELNQTVTIKKLSLMKKIKIQWRRNHSLIACAVSCAAAAAVMLGIIIIRDPDKKPLDQPNEMVETMKAEIASLRDQIKQGASGAVQTAENAAQALENAFIEFKGVYYVHGRPRIATAQGWLTLSPTYVQTDFGFRDQGKEYRKAISEG